MKLRLFLFLALLFGACACSTVNTVERAAPSGNAGMVDDKRVITDGALDEYAYVAAINESFVSGNLLKIQAKIVNSTAAFRSANYKFTWFGADGMQVGETPWGVVTLEGGESKYISAVAPMPNVRTFTLTLLTNVR